MAAHASNGAASPGVSGVELRTSCGRRETFTSLVVLLVWISSLLTFALAHVCATCATDSHDATFTVATLAMAGGALLAGYVSDRIGRLWTLRLGFGIGCIGALASAVVQADETSLLVSLAGLAGVAAGSSHVASQLLGESLPVPFRSWLLACYPALFFPVGAVMSLLESVPINDALAATLTFVALSAVGLIFMSESKAYTALLAPPARRRMVSRFDAPLPRFLRRAHRPSEAGSSVSRESIVAREVGQDGDMLSPIESLPRSATSSPHSAETGDVETQPLTVGASAFPPLHGLLRDGAAEAPRAGGERSCLRKARVRVYAALHARCGTDRALLIMLACMWILLTPAYYAAGLAFFIPGDSVTVSDAAACAWRFAPHPDKVTPPLSSATPGCDATPHVDAFRSGGHMLAAEILAAWAVAAASNSPRMGRRGVLALACAATVAAVFLTAASLPALGCDGSDGRAFLEFLTRICMAACTQSLFLVTMETLGTFSRSGMMGACVATFRIGALLTLLNTSTAGGADGALIPSRLQWTVYALQHPYGAGVGAQGGAHVYAGILAACGVPFAVLAAMAALLPIDTRTKLLRRHNRESFENADDAVAQQRVRDVFVDCSRALSSAWRLGIEPILMNPARRQPQTPQTPSSAVESTGGAGARARNVSASSLEDEMTGLMPLPPAAVAGRADSNGLRLSTLAEVDEEDDDVVSLFSVHEEEERTDQVDATLPPGAAAATVRHGKLQDLSPTIAGSIRLAEEGKDAGALAAAIDQLNSRERALRDGQQFEAAREVHDESLRLRLLLRTLQAAGSPRSGFA